MSAFGKHEKCYLADCKGGMRLTVAFGLVDCKVCLALREKAPWRQQREAVAERVAGVSREEMGR